MSEKLHYVATREDFELVPRMLVEIEEQVVVVFLHEGKLYASDERCPHRAGPLSEAEIKSGCVICPWHKSTFELGTGKLLSGPAKVGIRFYPVLVEGVKVYVQWESKKSSPP